MSNQTATDKTTAPKPIENGKTAAAIATAPKPTETPAAPAAPKAPKVNRNVLRHQKAKYRLEMAATARTLAHIAEAAACTNDEDYKGTLMAFELEVNEYRARLDADLAKAEGAKA